jgi:hypothetical protein
MGRLNVEGLLLNTKIDRGLPKESEWKVYAPQVPLYETQHPLTETNLNLIKNFTVPGAKFVRFVFSRVDITSSDNPLLRVREPATSSEPEDISLKLNNSFRSDYIVGEQIGFRLNVHYPGSWGLRIEALEYQ